MGVKLMSFISECSTLLTPEGNNQYALICVTVAEFRISPACASVVNLKIQNNIEEIAKTDVHIATIVAVNLWVTVADGPNATTGYYPPVALPKAPAPPQHKLSVHETCLLPSLLRRTSPTNMSTTMLVRYCKNALVEIQHLHFSPPT